MFDSLDRKSGRAGGLTPGCRECRKWKEGGGVKCVLITYPSYVWLSVLAIAGIVVLGLFTATELTILCRSWRLARQDAAWSQVRADDEGQWRTQIDGPQ
jgi:hypothetical protein